jgi:hypothetical protein
MHALIVGLGALLVLCTVPTQAFVVRGVDLAGRVSYFPRETVEGAFWSLDPPLVQPR